MEDCYFCLGGRMLLAARQLERGAYLARQSKGTAKPAQWLYLAASILNQYRHKLCEVGTINLTITFTFIYLKA